MHLAIVIPILLAGPVLLYTERVSWSDLVAAGSRSERWGSAAGADRGGTMICPFCAHLKDKVVDSRETGAGDAIRRRRECLSCGRRFTSYERVEEIPYFVVKKDGRREPFDRQKLMVGLHRACEKRPVPAKALSAIVDEIEQVVQDAPEREIPARAIGERVMERLKELDKVAYVRFASVYRQFEDVEEFMSELRNLVETRK